MGFGFRPLPFFRSESALGGGGDRALTFFEMADLVFTGGGGDFLAGAAAFFAGGAAFFAGGAAFLGGG